MKSTELSSFNEESWKQKPHKFDWHQVSTEEPKWKILRAKTWDQWHPDRLYLTCSSSSLHKRVLLASVMLLSAGISWINKHQRPGFVSKCPSGIQTTEILSNAACLMYLHWIGLFFIKCGQTKCLKPHKRPTGLLKEMKGKTNNSSSQLKNF